jgi:chloramphenicol-sensitive protein RarD
LVPLYFKQIIHFGVPTVVVHRALWTPVFLCVVLTALRRWPDAIACFRSANLMLRSAGGSVLIVCNWIAFIYGMQGEVLQTSLGYFISPLVMLLCGLVILQERLRRAQWVAVAVMVSGIACMVWEAGQRIWIALSIAITLGLYGILRKKTPIDAVVALTVETLLVLPFAVAAAAWMATTGHGPDLPTLALLAPSGAVTALPLALFGAAARRTSLTTLSFMQYITPSMTFVLAVYTFGEELGPLPYISFYLIWLALGIVSVNSLRSVRSKPSAKGSSPCVVIDAQNGVKPVGRDR